jgi:gamma-glutamyltranspeptidase / glutathione hydrolase
MQTNKDNQVKTSLSLILTLCLVLVPFQKASPAAPPVVTYKSGAVAADSPVASEIGAKILASGGDAVDAAVATALALGVLHPHSSGLGGGGLMLIYRADEKKTYSLDFREVAPKAASPKMYEKDPAAAQVGGLAVGVPAEVAGLVAIHKKFGKRPWKELFLPAQKLAKDGFVIDGALSQAINQVWPTIEETPSLKQMLSGASSLPPKEGDLLKNPALAKTFEALAKDPSTFYTGALAKEIVKATTAEEGILTEDDLSSYRVQWREPARGEYRGYEVLSSPPPSSGGTIIIELLNVLEKFDLKAMGHNSSTYIHTIAEAMQHGFADRARLFGDPAFVEVPVSMLTSQGYADAIAAKISDRTHPADYYGAPAATLKDNGTTHFSIIDAKGNAVAMTTTVNLFFGSRVMVGGFPLNDQLDDFSQPGVANGYGLIGSTLNQVEPGKRPLSSVSPTIVLKDGVPFLVLGASGGPRIISGVLQVIVNVIDFGADVSRAVDLARVHHQWAPRDLMIEPEITQDTRDALRARGHQLKELPPGYLGAIGIVQVVSKDPKTGLITAASDPRKGGVAAGY